MGWTNDVAGLSLQGRDEALATASKLKNYQIDTAYHSDLLRTSETATIIGDQLNLISTPHLGIRERNLGNFAGHTGHEIMTNRPLDWLKFQDHHDLDWNGLQGESLRDVHARFHSFMEHLHAQHVNQSVLLITHSGILHTILRDYFHFFPTESFIEVAHDSITILDKVGDSYALTLHNS